MIDQNVARLFRKAHLFDEFFDGVRPSRMPGIPTFFISDTAHVDEVSGRAQVSIHSSLMAY